MMPETILIGQDNRLERAPAGEWHAQLRGAPARIAERLRFMTPEHHRVRRFAFSELIRRGKPLEPAWIANRLNISVETVETILDDLERHLFFLVRDASGRVSWAFPVTSEPTGHRLLFSSGETIFAA